MNIKMNGEVFDRHLLELVGLQASIMLDKYLSGENPIPCFSVSERVKPIYFHGFELAQRGEEFRERMLNNPEDPVFASFSCNEEGVTLALGMLEGPTPKILITFNGPDFTKKLEELYQKFLILAKERLAVLGFKDREFLLSFQELVEINSPKVTISFYLMFIQENFSDIYQK